MNSQNTPQTTTPADGNFYKTLLALRNTYPPEDDLGIPKLPKKHHLQQSGRTRLVLETCPKIRKNIS
jgi:hypothetical protein